MSDKVAGVAVQILAMAIFLSVIVIFVGIGFLILIHVWIVGRAFRRGLGNGSNMVVMVGSATTTGGGKMSKDDLEKLPMYDYIAREKGSSPVNCAVCLDNFKMGERCRLLPLCKHSFHAQCVDAWLMQTLSCPLCRASTADDSKDGGLLPGTDVGVELSDRQATGNRDLSDHRIDLEENQAA